MEGSATCNKAQLVVDSDGGVVVPMYDWASFFAPIFKKLPEIKVTHHFHVSSSKPGFVVTKKHSDSAGKEYNILKDGVELDQDEMPAEIEPKGLSLQRQWYLHDKIREFCPVAAQDITCPEPSAPRPDSRHPSPEPPGPTSPSHPPPAKRPRRCGQCGKLGHNKRSCSLDSSAS